MSLTIAGALGLLALAAWAIADSRAANRRLDNLRRNAFLTDERGVRVRYSAASQAVRDRAEGN